jgi:SAM-dependent methyltransferase
MSAPGHARSRAIVVRLGLPSGGTQCDADRETVSNDRAQWQVAGSAPEVYERELVPAVFGPWAPRVVGLADLHPGDCVLDLACGTGVVARTAAKEVGEHGAVVAADLNPGMIALARSLPAPRGAAVEWREADAGALPFADQAFDAVLCQLGLQFFADRSTAAREMYRVLRPGGRVVVMVWRGIERATGFALLAEALERHIGPEAASTMRAPFSLGDAEELTSLIAAAGFEGLDLRAETGAVRFASVPRFVASYVAGSPLAGHVAASPPEARDALLAEVVAKLEPLADDQLEFPIEAYLACALGPL